MPERSPGLKIARLCDVSVISGKEPSHRTPWRIEAGETLAWVFDADDNRLFSAPITAAHRCVNANNGWLALLARYDEAICALRDVSTVLRTIRPRTTQITDALNTIDAIAFPGMPMDDPTDVYTV